MQHQHRTDPQTAVQEEESGSRLNQPVHQKQQVPTGQPKNPPPAQEKRDQANHKGQCALMAFVQSACPAKPKTKISKPLILGHLIVMPAACQRVARH
jgi:hypothetical protein